MYIKNVTAQHVYVSYINMCKLIFTLYITIFIHLHVKNSAGAYVALNITHATFDRLYILTF